MANKTNSEIGKANREKGKRYEREVAKKIPRGRD